MAGAASHVAPHAERLGGPRDFLSTLPLLTPEGLRPWGSACGSLRRGSRRGHATLTLERQVRWWSWRTEGRVGSQRPRGRGCWAGKSASLRPLDSECGWKNRKPEGGPPGTAESGWAGDRLEPERGSVGAAEPRGSPFPGPLGKEKGSPQRRARWG